jgi:GAG-pre-integrase domain
LDKFEDSEIQPQMPEDELMLWHHRLAHIPFKRLHQMAALGDILKKLAKHTPQKCHVCLHGKATRIPWQHKGKDGKAESG